MKQFLRLLFLILFVACEDEPQPKRTATADERPSLADTSKLEASQSFPNIDGLDTPYEISITHQSYFLVGDFDTDSIADTAVIVRHKATGNDALYVKHGGTGQSFLLEDGKSVGADFSDYNWIGQLGVVKKGTSIWSNVVNGEIVGEDRIPDSKKIVLPADGIFVHVDEGSGGGIIYFKQGKYVWVQQD